MLSLLPTPSRRLAPPAQPSQSKPVSAELRTRFPGFGLELLGMERLKSFAILVGYTQGGTPLPTRVPEARYAYYRRCRQFRRNGEQCKAPAMKGEPICHSHAAQAEDERRRQRQRRELLSRPGMGFGSFNAIQRTISELARAILADAIDRKAAGRLMMEIQAASAMLRQQQRLGARSHKGTPRKEQQRSNVVRESPGHRSERRCSAVAGRIRKRNTSTKQPRHPVTNYRDGRLKLRQFPLGNGAGAPIVRRSRLLLQWHFIHGGGACAVL
jgi:hypothetical protein